jgi:hypothetical protein
MLARGNDKRSLINTLRFPPKECKLGSGDGIEDPRTGIAAGTVTSIDVGQGLVALRRGPSLSAVALPERRAPRRRTANTRRPGHRLLPQRPASRRTPIRGLGRLDILARYLP